MRRASLFTAVAAAGLLLVFAPGAISHALDTANTSPATSVTDRSAVLHGNATSSSWNGSGTGPLVRYRWGSTPAMANGTNPTPLTHQGTDQPLELDGLNPGTTYYYRFELYGGAQGSVLTFNTKKGPASADIGVTTSAGPAQVQLGQPLSLLSTVTVSGSPTTEDAVFEDEIPASFTVLDYAISQGGCEISPGLVRCNLGTVDDDVPVNVSIFVKPTTAGTFTSNASVSEATSDPNTSNNYAAAQVTVLGLAPTTTTTPAAPAPAPTVVHVRRTVALASPGKRGPVSGAVSASFAACKGSAAVQLQRHTSSGWTTVGRTRTNSTGGFKFKRPLTSGSYRAFAPSFTVSSHACAAAGSSPRALR